MISVSISIVVDMVQIVVLSFVEMRYLFIKWLSLLKGYKMIENHLRNETASSSKYAGIKQAITERGKIHIKTLYFFTYFTLGFAFFKSNIQNQHDADSIIRVLLDEALALYSLCFFAGCFFIFKCLDFLSKKSSIFECLKNIFYWLSNTSYEFILGLLVVYMFGFAVHAPISVNSIPWLDTSNFYAYVFFSLSLIFITFSLGLFAFVEKEVLKQSNVPKILLIISLTLFLVMLLANIKS
ncbi:hypothetical protein [Aeromonas dhakensis]|uniref:hypothetical protein n=1 Tax=Aeromonas dhakensis TaxID=196024 RepID=UPI00288D8EC2|nr:hypothetical protein [Aeromonas dhakensis]HDX9011202.1 hypothetical protein [Aeromonas dhakensis]